MCAPLIIVSGPSGSGKSTLVQHLMASTNLPLHLSVSATTRSPRPDEVDGQHYHFWSQHRFEQEIASGTFLEWARVHGKDYYYGTPASEVEPYLKQCTGVILVIDVQGAAQVRVRYPDVFSIFVRVPNDDYRSRLLLRGDDVNTIERRMQTAREELGRMQEYSVLLMNDRLDSAVAELRRLVESRFGSCLKEKCHAG